MRVLLNQSKDAPADAPKLDQFGSVTAVDVQRNKDASICVVTNGEDKIRHVVVLTLMNEEKQDLVQALAGGLFAKLHNLRKEWKSVGKKDPSLFATNIDALIHELDNFERTSR